MNTLGKSIIALFITCISFSTFAEDKIIVKGEPIMLEQQGDMYILPGDYTSTTSYHYVTLNGTRRVCYLETQPSLSSLDVITINVQMDNETAVWNCYEYNPEYFVIE